MRFWRGARSPGAPARCRVATRWVPPPRTQLLPLPMSLLYTPGLLLHCTESRGVGGEDDCARARGRGGAARGAAAASLDAASLGARAGGGSGAMGVAPPEAPKARGGG